MGKKIEVEFIGDEIKVFVMDGMIVLIQIIMLEMIKEVEKDFGVLFDVVVKFFVMYVLCFLCNVGNDVVVQVEMMEEIIKGIKVDEVWIFGYFKVFCKEIFLVVVVEVYKVKVVGQDQVIVVFIVFGVLIEVVIVFVVSFELMNQGFNDIQIVEIFIVGVKGESVEDIMKCYGLSDEKLEGV